MSKKLLELCERCMKYNVAVSIKPCLSDAQIELQGDYLVYDKKRGKYEYTRSTRFISIDDIRSCKIDVVERMINDIFYELMEERGKMNDE